LWELRVMEYGPCDSDVFEKGAVTFEFEHAFKECPGQDVRWHFDCDSGQQMPVFEVHIKPPRVGHFL